MSTININHGKFISFPLLLNFKNEIIYGGYFQALGGPCVVITTALINEINLSLSLLVITYLIPLMVYGFDHYRDMEKDKDTNPERAIYFKRKSQIYPFILGGYLVTLIILLIFLTNWMMISFIAFLMIGGILYPLGLKKFTKSIPAFKNMYTTLIWALAGTFSVLFFYINQINLTYILIFLFLYLRMLPNTIFFDLKDIKNDAKSRLKTIPVILGKQNTLKFLMIINILAFTPLFLGWYMKIFPVYAIVMTAFIFYSIYYLRKAYKAEEIKGKYYLISDAEFMLWPVVLFTGKLLLYII